MWRLEFLRPDLEKLREIGGNVASFLASVPGSTDIKLEQTAGLPVLTAKVDSAALAAYGVTAQEALDTVAASRSGKVVGVIYQGKPRYDLAVKFAKERLVTAEDIGGLPVGTMERGTDTAKQLTSITRSQDAAQITHLATDRTYMVQVNVRGRGISEVLSNKHSGS